MNRRFFGRRRDPRHAEPQRRGFARQGQIDRRFRQPSSRVVQQLLSQSRCPISRAAGSARIVFGKLAGGGVGVRRFAYVNIVILPSLQNPKFLVCDDAEVV